MHVELVHQFNLPCKVCAHGRIMPGHAPTCFLRIVVLDTDHHGKADSHNGADSEEVQRKDVRLLAHSLVGFAAQQDLRLDTFAMGPASRALGQRLPLPLHPPSPPPLHAFPFFCHQPCLVLPVLYA